MTIILLMSCFLVKAQLKFLRLSPGVYGWDSTHGSYADSATIWNAVNNASAGSSSIVTVGTLTAGSIPYSLLTGTVPTWNQNTTGTASNITGSSNTTLNSLSSLNTIGTLNSLALAAGTATVAPITFTPSSAVLLTNAAQGKVEADANGIAYYTHATGERGVIDAEQFIALTSSYTLTSQTAAQKLFNATTSGQVTLASSTSYYFECEFTLSSMSSTSGSFGFAFGGTATITSQAWQSYAVKSSTLTTPGTAQLTFNTAANTTLVTASTATGGICTIRGIIRINAGGTLIPEVSLGVAASAIVGVNSYFRIVPCGTNTVTNIGNFN